MSNNDNKSGGDGNLFALMLASGKSVRHAARIAKVAPSTGYRWSKSPKLQRAVQKIRAEMFRRAAGQLADAATEATQVLTRLLRSDSESVRLAAARSILDRATKFREAIELEDRLQQIEEKLHFEGAKRQLRAARIEVEAEMIEEGQQ